MLGDMLRQERERQNLSVKDIERETSIRSLYISSIEAGKYDAVPGEVYLKGFIKTYATFLNLDGAAMLKLYYEEKRLNTAELDADSAQAREAVSPETAERKSVRELREEKKKSSGGASLAVAGILLCICIGGGAYFFFSGGSAEKAMEPKAVATEPARQERPAAPAPKEKPVPAAMGGIEVKASFTGRCWTHVEADGKVLYEGIPKTGERLAWKADKELVITAGNAGAVELVSNGKALGKLGNNGEVVTKKFNKEGGALPKEQ